MQELIAAASAIMGAIVGGIVGAGAPLFIDHWYRPILELEEDRPEAGHDWSGHAISITNKGLRTARNCHGMMQLSATPQDLCPDNQLVYASDLGSEFVKKFDVEGRETLLLHQGNWRPIANELLAWAQLGNPPSIDIYPKTHPMLDIFRLMRVANRTHQLHFVSEGGWTSLRGAFKVKEYELTITVGAENARAATRGYRLRPEGDDIQVVPTAMRRMRWWPFETGG
jgi:hypothetical protein